MSNTVTVYSVSQSGERMFSTTERDIADTYSKAGVVVSAITTKRATQ